MSSHPAPLKDPKDLESLVNFFLLMVGAAGLVLTVTDLSDGWWMAQSNS